MEKLDLSKLKLASSSIGERIKTSGAQMGRTISSKMKEILADPTPESKIVDEATAETLAEPNWGLNLRICAMISRGEYDGAEIVRAIKRKLVAGGRNPATQGLSLDLLEACTSNCEKVFSEVASEKVLDDMVKLIEDSRTDHGNRVRAMQLIRSWGESTDLQYLPVFRQTYMDDLTIGILAKCKRSLPIVQRIVETTADDEVMLFDALNLHDELQLVISRHAELAAASESKKNNAGGEEVYDDSNIANETTLPLQSRNYTQ